MVQTRGVKILKNFKITLPIFKEEIENMEIEHDYKKCEKCPKKEN